LDGLKLGRWVSVQRLGKANLTQDKIRRLDSINFSWDPRSEQWEEGFAALQKFKERKGHCMVPQDYFFEGLHLGSWVLRRRQNKSQLTAEQISLLDSIGFSWDPHTEHWDKCFKELEKFRKTEGHCRVPRKNRVNGLNIGLWVDSQRRNKEKLTAEQIRRLDSLGYSWDPHADTWEQGFTALLQFQKSEGHCRVAAKYMHPVSGFKLGSWVSTQRLKKSQLTADKVKRLDSIGFTWDPITEQWEKGFAALVEFHQRQGHSRAAKNNSGSDLKVGTWVATQRKNKHRLTAEQIRRLDSLGFRWDPYADTWEQGFLTLQSFKQSMGHCRVPQTHMFDNFKLGSWVARQRQTKMQLSNQQVRRLDALGFSWDPFSEDWEYAFKLLKAFHKREGHCRVPESHIEEQFRLGAWVKKQRACKDKQTPARIRLLESVSFIWKAR
jgi:hypothetical protein